MFQIFFCHIGLEKMLGFFFCQQLLNIFYYKRACPSILTNLNHLLLRCYVLSLTNIDSINFCKEVENVNILQMDRQADKS